MTARDIFDEIRMLGGRLEARGDRLHVEAPKGVLKPEHRKALAALKPELLALLQTKREAGDLEASMKRLEAAQICVGVWEDGSMRIVLSESDTVQAIDEGGTLYSPADMTMYVTLSERERKMLHEFKKRFGGSVECKPVPGGLLRDATEH